MAKKISRAERMKYQSQRMIDEFYKSSIEYVRTYLSEWRGKTYLDIQIWISTGFPGEEAMLRDKGIRIRVSLLDSLIESLEKAKEALDSKSSSLCGECGFDSLLRHQSSQRNKPLSLIFVLSLSQLN